MRGRCSGEEYGWTGRGEMGGCLEERIVDDR